MADPDFDPAKLFLDMAARIHDIKNEDEFAGAILIVPPYPEDGSEPEPIEVLILNPRPNEAHFWHVVKVHYELGEGNWARRVDQGSRGYR